MRGARPQLVAGTDVTVPIVDNLTRSTIVQYAGASGDYNPLHTDERYARDIAGHPTVMAHGMLTMGLTGTALVSVVGQEGLLRFGGRFLGPVWPGDSLTMYLHVTDVTQDETDSELISLSVRTENQAGKPVFSGSALARRATRDLSR
jgi:acyl dehydratase